LAPENSNDYAESMGVGTSVAAVIKVAVFGAHGRMGTQACRAIELADDLELVARIGSADPPDPVELCEVAVDLTVPAAVMDHVHRAIEQGVHVVAGTSGFDDDRLQQIRSWLRDHPGVGVLVAPNLSIGALLMMRMAAQAAPYFETVEIVETHHPDKVDAPSGTAMRTAELVGSARERAGRSATPDATRHEFDGARGANVGNIRIHSRRIRGVVAEQEVLLGAAGETLAIRHTSTDRASFMTGLLAAISWIPDHPGLTVGLEQVLGL
jgi:4-hydroxy-tetrahydrodipicolinate reductase